MSAAEVQLHHMARRHHATMKQLDGIKDKIAGISHRFAGTIETGIGAWFGGLVEGKLGTSVPALLLGGTALLADYLGMGTTVNIYETRHLANLGNGLLGSYLAGIGYRFGQRRMTKGVS